MEIVSKIRRPSKITRSLDQMDGELNQALRDVLAMEPEYIYSADKAYALKDGVDINFIFIQIMPCLDKISSVLSIKVPALHVAEQLDLDMAFYERLKNDAKDLPESKGPKDIKELTASLAEDTYKQVFFDRASLVRYATQRHSADILFVAISSLKMHSLRELTIRGHDGVVKPSLLIKTSISEVLKLFNQLHEVFMD